jgi:hypothetical protein
VPSQTILQPYFLPLLHSHLLSPPLRPPTHTHRFQDDLRAENRMLLKAINELLGSYELALIPVVGGGKLEDEDGAPGHEGDSAALQTCTHARAHTQTGTCVHAHSFLHQNFPIPPPLPSPPFLLPFLPPSFSPFRCI